MFNHCDVLSGDLFREGIQSAFLPGLAGQVEQALFPYKEAFRVRYPYGSLFVQSGQFQTPCEAQKALTPCASCQKLTERVRWSGNDLPLMLVTQNHAEVFLDALPQDSQKEEERTAKSRGLRVLGSGDLLGVFEALDGLYGQAAAESAWHIAAGARSVIVPMPGFKEFMRKKLSDSQGERPMSEEVHDLIKKDDWELIKQAHRENTDPEYAYTTELIVFPIKWQDQTIEEIYGFVAKLAQIGWDQSRNFRTRLTALRQPDVHRFILNNKTEIGCESLFYGVLDHLERIVNGQNPVFVPAHQKDAAVAVPILAFAKFATNGVSESSRDQASDIPIYHPKHLVALGDAGYFSIRYNSLSFMGVPKKPRTYDGFVSTLIRFLQNPKHKSILGLQSLRVEPAKAPLYSGQYPNDLFVKKDHPFFDGMLKVTKA